MEYVSEMGPQQVLRVGVQHDVHAKASVMTGTQNSISIHSYFLIDLCLNNTTIKCKIIFRVH